MKKLTQKDFVERSSIKYANKYDYSLSNYTGQDEKVLVICPLHGEFKTRPADHMAGRAQCFECSRIQAAQNKVRWSAQKYVKEASVVHNEKYSYDVTQYTNINGKIRFRCATHGWNETSAASHLYQKSGCLQCSGKQKRTTEEFINEAKNIHGDRYDYTKVEYKNGHTPVVIICAAHGEFLQSHTTHIRQKSNCPQCAAYGISKVETEWLDSLKVPQRNVRRNGLCFDGFDPDTNTVYEFHGDFWHGNPEIYSPNDINSVNNKKFGELFHSTKAREYKIKGMGYNLVVIWESEWKSKRN